MTTIRLNMREGEDRSHMTLKPPTLKRHIRWKVSHPVYGWAFVWATTRQDALDWVDRWWGPEAMQKAIDAVRKEFVNGVPYQKAAVLTGTLRTSIAPPGHERRVVVPDRLDSIVYAYEGLTFATKRAVEAQDSLAKVFPRRRTWGWWCWLLGHQPTETTSFQRELAGCKCGAVEVTKQLRAERCSPFWMALVRNFLTP